MPPPDARVVAIIGTRPEAIKMAPVLRALEARGVACTLLCTGQHPGLDLRGANMTAREVERLHFTPDALDTDTMCDRMEALVHDRLRHAGAALVIVQGDTNSALAGARAAARRGIAVAHVEAGLRTFDLTDPWPEERNRVAIDRIAALLFAPSPQACRNLEAEGVRGHIVLSGNSGIDAVVETASEFAQAQCSSMPMILTTVHRRENRGAGVRSVAAALHRIAREAEVDFVIPLHPNPDARAEVIAATAGVPRCTLLEPQSYRDTVALILRSRLILTDSGGLQEEGPALGRPVLILRASTERPEAIASGNAMLVGTDPDRVAGETLRVLHDEATYARMSIAAFPFGMPGAAARIADAIADWLTTQAAPEARTLDPTCPPAYPQTHKPRPARGPFV